jgi:hypothetical protein
MLPPRRALALRKMCPPLSLNARSPLTALSLVSANPRSGDDVSLITNLTPRLGSYRDLHSMVSHEHDPHYVCFTPLTIILSFPVSLDALKQTRP